MKIPYRTRKLLQRIGITVLILLLVVVLILVANLLWSDKYIYYTRQGAVMDRNQPPISENGKLAVPPDGSERVPIYYDDGQSAANTNQELTQLVGYYIDAEQLQDISAVKAQLQALPRGTPVMVEVKSIYGSYYYSSAITSTRSDDIDPAAMDELIRYLDQSGAYIIAKLPALRDKEYGLNHVDDGVFDTRGAYLWVDDNGCYWLNPAKEGTLNRLTIAINELKGLGFDEVVFDDFCLPEDANASVNEEMLQSLVAAAKTLVSSCATDSFAVSFVGDGDFQLPEGRTRLYVKSAAAAEAVEIAQKLNFEDPAVKLVFLTENHDTRFNAYGVLRPLSSAH